MKKDSYWAWLAYETSEAANRHRQAEQNEAQAITEAKIWVWMEFREAMKKDFQTASRVSGKPSGDSRRLKKLCSTFTVFSAGGAMLTLNDLPDAGGNT